MWHLWQQKVKTSCNARMRARVRVRFLLIHCFFAETTLRFSHRLSTNTDWRLYVYTETHNNIISCKQAVVLMKTTRRFGKNNTSFWWKQYVVLVKTTRRFNENNTSLYERLWCFRATLPPKSHKKRIVHSLLTPNHRIKEVNIKKTE